MNALTLYQPWASLVAMGAKKIETRSWPPPAAAIGERLAIHAAAKPPFLIEGTVLAEYAIRVGWPNLALGAVVASCVLADVVPIEEGTDELTAGGARPCVVWVPDDHPTQWAGTLTLYRDHTGHGVEIDQQCLFGDFSPGRFAWLLEDVKPTTERCPWCWGTGTMHWRCEEHGIWTDQDELQQVQPDGHDACPLCVERDDLVAFDCVTCKTEGVCDPIPASGHQRIWQWEPEEARA